MKKILLIGGNGFIGSNLCKTLSIYEYEIYSFDLHIPESKREGVKYIEGDFFNSNLLREIVRGMDLVVHLLSTINPGNSNVKYMEGYQKDFIQSIKLCEAIIEEQSKLLFISSGGTVYGDKGFEAVGEECLPEPMNHYGNLKLCIENTMLTFARQRNLNVIIARVSNVYGPGQDYTKGVGFIDAALKKAMSNQLLEIWGDGSIIRDYIYIDDVCKILERLLFYHGEIKIFNVCSSEKTSQNDIIKIIKEIGEEVAVIYKEIRAVDAKSVFLDNSKLRFIYQDELISIKEGIKKYYLWLQEQS